MLGANFSESFEIDLHHLSFSVYIKEYDELRQVYKDKPLHNWASHGAEALQHLVLGYEPEDLGVDRPTKAISDFDPMNYEHDRQHTYESDYDPMAD